MTTRDRRSDSGPQERLPDVQRRLSAPRAGLRFSAGRTRPGVGGWP